jgi:hypothetical protein
MPSFVVKVPNGDDGEDLGVFEADYLPRVGDKFLLFHPKLTGSSSHPFEGEVSAICWEAFSKDHKYGAALAALHDANADRSVAQATVWLAEYCGVPTIYCDCKPTAREHFGIDSSGDCVNCGHRR